MNIRLHLDAGLYTGRSFESWLPAAAVTMPVPQCSGLVSENAGFTAGTPWLRVNSNYTAINAGKSDRLIRIPYLSFYKKLIALRKDPEYKETVVYGALEPFMEDRAQSNGILP